MDKRVPRKKSDTRAALMCGASSFLAALALAAFLDRIPIAIPAIYFLTSIVTAAIYASDKARAERGDWRFPESTLHFFELIGGWPGALVAQQWFRHKTRKVSFQIIFWLIVLAHLAAWIFLLSKPPP